MKRQLCLLVAVIVSMSAQGQSYRMVQGRIVPRNSPDWTVIRDRIEIIGFSGPNLLCRTFTTRDADATITIPGRRGPVGVATTREVKVYKETFVLANYPAAGRFTRGDVLPPPIAVMRVSSQIVHSGSDIKDRVVSSGYDLYDYGVDYVPPARKLTTEEAAAAKAQAVKMNAGAETAKLKFDEEQAENGKDFYQYRIDR